MTPEAVLCIKQGYRGGQIWKKLPCAGDRMGNKNQRDGKTALHHFHGCMEYALWKKSNGPAKKEGTKMQENTVKNTDMKNADTGVQHEQE